ncbi:putative glutamate carboxypeptidase [Aspergillus bombycis]|uniref:Putative glutamate carboxypeptidase n=1 Tax=Aspergillus bombycis TaxID=109264 RepID=A0A1F8AD41_9EURO|nr:putative glutamate carboxypeptidase [Aspergillus bombycis]OGM49268.1 putative glutamate carboxypeptidase [Aspergillus bombycis]
MLHLQAKPSKAVAALQPRFFTIPGPLICIAMSLFLNPLSLGVHASSAQYPVPSPSPIRHGHSLDIPARNSILPSDLQEIILNGPDEQKAREWNLHYTSEPHFVGQGEPLAVWTQDKWREFGIENTSIKSYPAPDGPTLPLYQRLALLERKPGNAEDQDDTVLFNASLNESSTFVNPVSGKIISSPQFFSCTPNANVTAPFVFVNYGTDSDYDDLMHSNIDVSGMIGIMKQGKPYIRSALGEAQKRGMVGLVVYLDPEFDENVTEAHGYLPFPEGPARAPSSVVRRMGFSRNDPSLTIPVIPISYSDALPFLKALNGHGPQASELSTAWQGGQLGYLGVNYNVGPSPDGLTMNLVNTFQSYNVSVYNVLGTIKGEVEDEVIILGNHRDAWAAGAGDPNSGSAALNEVIRTLGTAMKKGWRPFRTLVFVSWDGHETGGIGSTAWLKENLPWLSRAVVAYLEIETAATGTKLFTKSSPLLRDVIYSAAEKVLSPDQSQPGQSIMDAWGGQIEPEGGGDTNGFVSNGFTSINLGFAPGPTDPIFHWHSDFDNIQWMDTFGDPTYEYHTASAKLWALAATHLADEPVVAFNATAYAVAMDGYLDELRDTLKKATSDEAYQQGANSCTVNLQPLKDAIAELYQVAVQFDADAADLAATLTGKNTILTASTYRKNQRIQDINQKYRTFERQFVVPSDSSRVGSSHVVYSRSSYKFPEPTFPDITNNVKGGKWCDAEKSNQIVADAVRNATQLLRS